MIYIPATEMNERSNWCDENLPVGTWRINPQDYLAATIQIPVQGGTTGSIETKIKQIPELKVAFEFTDTASEDAFKAYLNA